MTMRNKLTGGSTRRCEAHAVNEVVETTLDELQKVFTGHTLLTRSLIEDLRKLTLQNSINIFCLLLFRKLCRIFALLRATLCGAMLSGRIVFLFENFIRSE